MVNIVLREIRRAWKDSAPLTAVTLVMLAAFIASCSGVLLDSRIITGVPAWLKPAKFAISTAIFCGTIAWLFRYITVWRLFMRAIGWILASVLVIEVAIIDLQAARGTASHFNIATPVDAVLFGVMGVSIGLLWLGSIGVLAGLLRQKFQNPAWGWWLRLGMLATVLGSAAGGLMLQTTPEQAATRKAGHGYRAVGGHTVGGPDGGPGIAGVGWSTHHGDLRITHFFGLHGVQIIPLIGWFAMRGFRAHSERRQSALAFTVAISYLTLVGILAWQALRGESIVNPSAATLTAMAVWLGATAAAIVFLQPLAFGAHRAAESS